MDRKTYYPAGVYHVTWVTHNSRLSQRMIDHNVPKKQGVQLNEKAETKITEIISVFHLWAQKFNKWFVQSDDQLRSAVTYIVHNREKHGLPENKGLQPLVLSLLSMYPNDEAAFDQK